MKEFCCICKKRKESPTWKYIQGGPIGWLCEDHFKTPAHEWTTESIKEQRVSHFKSLIQPWREGIASKEFEEAYPKQAKRYFKGEKTSYVYKDLPGWKNRHKSK